MRQNVYGQEFPRVIQLLFISDGNYDGGHYDLVVTTEQEADQVNDIYQTWRKERVKQLCLWSEYEDNTSYGTLLFLVSNLKLDGI